MPQRLELRSGAAPWLHAAQQLAFLLAALGLLIAPSAWPGKVAALAALLAAWIFHQKTSRVDAAPGRLILHLDGRLRLERDGGECDGMASPGGWVSRWFCVLRWTDLERGRVNHCLVCASANHADDYRRLLTCLRLGAFENRESHP